MAACSHCRKYIRERVFYDTLGQRCCGPCHDRISGLSLGMLSDNFGLAVVLAGTQEKNGRSNGLLQWIRTALNRNRK